MASFTMPEATTSIFLIQDFRPVPMFTDLKLETSSSRVKWYWRNNPGTRDSTVFRPREYQLFKKPLQCEEVFFYAFFSRVSYSAIKNYKKLYAVQNRIMILLQKTKI